MTEQVSRSKRINCHEAGHAIVAVRKGLPFDHMWRSKGESAGVEVTCNHPLESPTHNWTEEQIGAWQLFYTGGVAAELLLFGSCREAEAYGVDKDRHGKLEQCRKSARHDGWEQDVQDALKLLDKGAVEIIATELQRRREQNQGVGKLIDDDVYRLLKCKAPWW